METKMKEIVGTIIKCLQRMIGLTGSYKSQGDIKLKMKKLDCLLCEIDLMITEFEAYEEHIDEDII